MHLLCRHHCRRRSVAQFSQLCPPRCAETHSTGSHSAANRRAVPRHSSLSKWRRWYTVTASSSGHSSGSWISLLSRLAESLTVLLTGPRERIPSSSRNSFLHRTIDQLLEVEVPHRIEAAVQKPKMVHHDGFQQRTSKTDDGQPFSANCGRDRGGDCCRCLKERIQLSNDNAASAANRQAVSPRSRAAEKFKEVKLALINFMEGVNRNEAPRSLGHRSTSGLVHPRWRRRASMLTRSAVVTGAVSRRVIRSSRVSMKIEAHDRAQDKLFALRQQRPPC